MDVREVQEALTQMVEDTKAAKEEVVRSRVEVSATLTALHSEARKTRALEDKILRLKLDLRRRNEIAETLRKRIQTLERRMFDAGLHLEAPPTVDLNEEKVA